MISFEMRSDLGGALGRLARAGTPAMRRAFASRVGADSNRYCMVDSGDLKASCALASDEDVRWDTPYARYAYHAASARRDVNPEATPQWFETAKSRRLRAWQAFARALLVGDAEPREVDMKGGK